MAIYSKSETTIEGLDDIVRAFKKVQDKGRPYVKSASEKNAETIKKRAASNLVSNSSVKTGKLLRSLKVKEAKTKVISGGTVIFTVGPQYVAKSTPKGKGVNYGHLVELGHKTKSGKQVPAKPYLRPAADDNKEKFIRDVAEAMNAAVEQFGKG